jgi:hypothetical protein
MYGFLASARFNESAIWNYCSVTVYEETGGNIRTVRGKVFDGELIKQVEGLKIGQQVMFNIEKNNRGTRSYVQFSDIKAYPFNSCSDCGKPMECYTCDGCNSYNSERFDGEFEVVDISVTDTNQGVKLVLRSGEVQFTYIQWPNSTFLDKFTVGEMVYVCGWRSPNRITTVRSLYRVKIEDDSSCQT